MSGRTCPPGREEPSESPNNNIVMNKVLIETCLQRDKGQEAKLLSFEEKEITKKGDNFLCVVTSITVRYQLGNQKDLRASYVVKFNPQRQLSGTFLKEVFAKENGFYHEICPALNRELKEAGLPGLRTPRSPFTQMTEGKEVIFMGNLREQGFQMINFRKGLDKDHTLLVVRELARLHGASFLLQKKSKIDLVTSYPYLVDGLMKKGVEYEGFALVYRSLLKIGATIARRNEGYDKVAKCLEEELSPNCMDCIREHLQPHAPFAAVVHGDCWSNNLLFRYDSGGTPVDIRLVDLQIVRASSITTDLNYFFFTSPSGEVRRKNMDLFLHTYYDTLEDVVRAGGLQLDFTFEDFCEEYERRCLYGITYGLIITMMAMCGSCGGPDFADIKDNNFEEMMKKYEEFLVSMQEYPDIKERFLSTFDDMIEKGIVC
ncbi:putative oxidoreductase dhs-27 [Oratosquilla oratoria]|uniref:putative oxidoreductase dhs-27 n=1 Tax=Oratosquilla oratoria TaxID=337810 RepID=UPI003F76833D